MSVPAKSISRRQNFRLVQIKTNCRRYMYFESALKIKKKKKKPKKQAAYRVENIVRKEEIACYKPFLLFWQCFPQIYIFSASKCGIV